MSLTHVSTGSTVYASDFLAIRNQTASVLTDLYGYSNLESAQVFSGNAIRAEDWIHLYNDINRCWVHQTGTSFSAVVPQTGTNVLTAAFVNTLIDKANGVQTWYKNTVPSQQISSTVTFNTSLITDTPLDYAVAYTWFDNSDMNHFFNLGGKVTFNFTNTYLTTATNNSAIRTLLTQFNGSDVSYDNRRYPGSYTTSTTVSNNTLTVAYSSITNSSINATVHLGPAAGAQTDIGISVRDIYYASTASILAPLPAVGAGSLTIKRLSVDPIDVYSCQAGTTTTSKTVTVRNVGNSTLTVSTIYFNSKGSVHHVNLSGDFGGSADLTGEPLIPNYILNQTYNVPVANQSIAPAQSRTFTLAYTGLSVGTQTNSFTIVSDNDRGNVVSYTTITVQAAKFNFDLSPLTEIGRAHV